MLIVAFILNIDEVLFNALVSKRTQNIVSKGYLPLKKSRHVSSTRITAFTACVAVLLIMIAMAEWLIPLMDSINDATSQLCDGNRDIVVSELFQSVNAVAETAPFKDRGVDETTARDRAIGKMINAPRWAAEMHKYVVEGIQGPLPQLNTEQEINAQFEAEIVPLTQFKKLTTMNAEDVQSDTLFSLDWFGCKDHRHWNILLQEKLRKTGGAGRIACGCGDPMKALVEWPSNMGCPNKCHDDYSRALMDDNVAPCTDFTEERRNSLRKQHPEIDKAWGKWRTHFKSLTDSHVIDKYRADIGDRVEIRTKSNELIRGTVIGWICLSQARGYDRVLMFLCPVACGCTEPHEIVGTQARGQR
eukprot:gene57970-biopygen116611